MESGNRQVSGLKPSAGAHAKSAKVTSRKNRVSFNPVRTDILAERDCPIPVKGRYRPPSQAAVCPSQPNGSGARAPPSPPPDTKGET